MSFTIDWSDNKFKLRHEVQQPNKVIATLLRNMSCLAINSIQGMKYYISIKVLPTIIFLVKLQS